MLNVIEFRKRSSRPIESSAQRPVTAAGSDVSELTSRITALQLQAKGEIGNAILMLDLAAQHAREVARRISDPATKKSFDGHITVIEQLLQRAREMAFKL